MVKQDLPVHIRGEAADSLYYEAHCRMKDPIHGCVGIITLLHQQIYNAQTQLSKIQAEIAVLSAKAQTESHYQHQVEHVPNVDENF